MHRSGPPKKELELQFFPGHIFTWLSLTLAIGGKATGTPFSAVRQEPAHAVVGEVRGLTDDDLFTAGTQDCYLDVFRLAPGTRRDSRWPERCVANA
ncbi:hypothetical protein [Streptomyces sp. NPDC002690]